MHQKYKIIIDTNLWISFLLTKKFSFLDQLIENDTIQLIFCDELIDEFLEVITRPKLKKFFSNKELNHILEIISQKALFIDIISHIEICRDDKDNFLLALAKDSNADFLITGDKDLLVLKKIENTHIVTMIDFQTLKI